MALITISEARQRVLDAVQPLPSQTLPVAEALGRYLAADVLSTGDVPPFDASAMDGYAVLPGPAERRLRVAGESRAGAPSSIALPADTAIRISTGAAVPPGAGAVVRQEDVELEGESIVLRSAVAEGENIRPAGEVMHTGDAVLGRGARLGPPELAAAIIAGAGTLTVASRPQVPVLSTGDELRDPGATLGAGEIHDSNAPMLAALCGTAGARVLAADRLADDRAATEAGLARALEPADVLIAAGGVSVGPHDHVKPALAALGVQELFWGVALQPGKPTWAGARGNQLVFGLPGNPVSAAVTFVLFVAPALAALQGAREPVPPRRHAHLSQEVKRNAWREQAIRVRLEREDDRAVAVPTGDQASHNILSLVGADALALIPAGDGVLAAGSLVALEPLPR